MKKIKNNRYNFLLADVAVAYGGVYGGVPNRRSRYI